MSLSDDLKSAISMADVEQNLINTVPELREFIHFDTLWQLASLIVLEHGHLAWSDTAEHDPGTTLLQAATYAVADLSYRHSHPLIDLLTPGQGKPVFDPAFGPEKVLTVSPVTDDDYRRGILDLCDDQGFFMFRNAQLVRESEEESYRYFYDSAAGTFSFTSNDGSDPQVLLGGYTLYVEAYSWLYISELKPILNSYLIKHRNLGEQIRLITDVTANFRKMYPYIDVELDDDCQDPARVMGMIWETVVKLYAPWPRREVEEAHLASGGSKETLHEGPNLNNGWITELPPDMPLTEQQKIDLRKLPLELLKIDGIKQVRRLSWDPVEIVWVNKAREKEFLPFWNDNPEEDMTKENSTVRLFKRGQRQMVASTEVKPYINWPKITPSTPVTSPEGQCLNSLGNSICISGLLPDCYGVNDDVEQLDEAGSLQRKRLSDYLTLFQQWIDYGCAELAGVSRLLSFDQPIESIGSGYFQGDEKGLATIDYLLGYFGSQRAPRVFNKTGTDLRANDEFFESQRAALAQWAELGYGRANVPVNTVTAFNKRLAFRLGIGADMFSANPDLEKLPVYVIDYRTLLPEMPNVEFVDREVTQATLVTIDDNTNQLKLEFDDGPLPVAGQLISLRAEGITIPWALVVRVNAPTVYLDLNNNPTLKGKAEMFAGHDGTIICSNSDVWLRRMNYPLVYGNNMQVEPASVTDPIDEYKFELFVPYSVHLFSVGDIVAIDTSASKAIKNVDGLTAKVIEVNISLGTLRVSSTSAWPLADIPKFWYRVENEVTDRFSLKVGVVLDRELWLKNDDRLEEVVAWVAQIVNDEMPAHIQADVHWLSKAEFDYFGSNYKEWQQAAAESRLGESSYALLKQLSLGQLPAQGKGIGTYHIVTNNEMDNSEWYKVAESPPVSQWDEAMLEDVDEAQVLYIPRT